MRRMLALVMAVMLLGVQTVVRADAMFEEACSLLQQAAKQQDEVYSLNEEALDAIDALIAGEMTVDDCRATLIRVTEALRAMQPAEIVPSDALKAYLLDRGLSAADYQAVADGAVVFADYLAESFDPYISVWQEDEGAAIADTKFLRAGAALEKQLDFIALNSVILPETDEEAEAIARLVVAPTGYLTDANLPWERDMDVLLAKYDALEAEYGEILDQIEAQVDAMMAALDSANP